MRIRLLVIGLAAVLGLAACGGGDTTEVVDPGTDPALSPTPTPDASPTPETSPTPGATPTDAATEEAGAAAGDGAIAAAVDTTIAEGSAAFTSVTAIDTPDLSDSVQSSGVVDFTGDQRQINLTTDAGEVQTLVRDDGILASLGGGVGWVRVDPRDLQGTPLEAFGLATLPLQDPTVNLALLRGATEDVEEVGEEDIDGEAVTHWRVTVDVEQAAAQADAQAQMAIEQAGGTAGTIEVDVWTDDQDRIRRIQHETDLGDTELVADTEGTVEVTLDLTDFGASPEITEPDESRIVDVDEQTLQQLLQQVTG